MAQKHILVADDDDVIMQLIEHILTKAGYAVTCVSNGEQALKHAIQDQPDLVVLDGMMPGMDGVEVLRQIRENPETQSIPTVMLTARSMERNIVSALELGADEYIVKPFMPGELTVRINKLMAASKAQ